MNLSSNIKVVIADILSNVKEINNPETISRAAAAAVMPELIERIHERGEMPDGSKIGTYSNSYLKVRQREGKGSDTNVIISFTRQLQNGYTLTATDDGYTIGNISSDDDISPDGDISPNGYMKVGYMIELYGDIWKLSEAEEEMALIAAQDMANKLLNA